MSNPETAAGLFGDLPEMQPPSVAWTDEHALEPCPKCRGSGRHRYTFYGGGYGPERGSEPCRRCNGGGKVIRYIGPEQPA